MSEEVIYEGKAKKLLTTSDPDVLIQSFKDEATAFNGVKFGVFPGKGAINNTISCHLFELLEEAGVETHYEGRIDATQMRVRRLEIVPIEVVVRNVAAGSLSKRIGWEEGADLPRPIVETYYKKDELGDPMLAPTHIAMLGLVSEERWAEIERSALAVNDVLRARWAEVGVRLVDFKLEYGVDASGRVVLGDEISPDTSRLWDAETDRKLDKDVFRRDLADLVETYTEVLGRLGLSI